MSKASNSIFSNEVASNLDTVVSKVMTKNSLVKCVLLKSAKKHKVARASGVTSVVHCPIAIGLNMLIRNKMGYSGELYNLVASALGLPIDCCL